MHREQTLTSIFVYRRKCRHVQGEIHHQRVFRGKQYSSLRYPQIELKAEDLYDKEKVDLETIVIEDVFKLLDCTEGGLSDEEAARRLDIFGPNKLESEEQNAFLQVGRLFRRFPDTRLMPC